MVQCSKDSAPSDRNPDMSTAFPLTEKDRIQVGKPLPFSVFGADGKLLLAAGRVIESDRMREMLLRIGRYRGPLGLDDDSGGGGGGGLARGKRDAREAEKRKRRRAHRRRRSSACARSSTATPMPVGSR